MQLLTPSLQLNKRAHQFSDRTEFPSSRAAYQLAPKLPRLSLVAHTSVGEQAHRFSRTTDCVIPSNTVPTAQRVSVIVTLTSITFKMLAEDQSRLQKIDDLYDLRLDQCISLPQVKLDAQHISANADDEYHHSLSSWAINQAVKAQYLKV